MVRRIDILLLVVILFLSACQTTNQDASVTENGLTRKLTIELVSFRSKEDHLLHQKIRSFKEQRADVEIEIRDRSVYMYDPITPWLMDKKWTGDPPDLIELTPLQMELAYHHGKLEPLSFNTFQLGELLITSHDGMVLGLKTKINPLIVYYNRDTFSELALEEPSGNWDWTMLDNTLSALKAASKQVHIMLSPAILEWITINRYGGRIADASGTVFSGYLDSEEAIQGAEWLKWIGTIEENYSLGKIQEWGYDPMPRDLIDGHIALAIDFAHSTGPSNTGNNTFEAYIKQNDRIGIAPLPGGPDMVNVAHTSGLMIPTFSENKDLAMELLRYLASDADTYYEDILLYTLQSRSSTEIRDLTRLSILLQETKRSIPTSMYLNEQGGMGDNDTQYYWVRRRILNGHSAESELKALAQEMDTLIYSFKEDLANLAQCIKNHHRLCIH